VLIEKTLFISDAEWYTVYAVQSD